MVQGIGRAICQSHLIETITAQLVEHLGRTKFCNVVVDCIPMMKNPFATQSGLRPTSACRAEA
jgi:hypothetical protein